MGKALDALKTAIESMAKTIEDLKAENSRLQSEVTILKGKLAIAEMSKEKNVNPVYPSLPSIPNYPTWPTFPTYPTIPYYPIWPNRWERTVTWDRTNFPSKPNNTICKTIPNVEKAKVSCCLQ